MPHIREVTTSLSVTGDTKTPCGKTILNDVPQTDAEVIQALWFEIKIQQNFLYQLRS